MKRYCETPIPFSCGNRPFPVDKPNVTGMLTGKTEEKENLETYTPSPMTNPLCTNKNLIHIPYQNQHTESYAVGTG
jgi:hypothetical protein